MERPAEKKDRRAEHEEHELASHVPSEDAVEKRDSGDEKTDELEGAREEIHGAPCRRGLGSLGDDHAVDAVSLFDPLDDVLSRDDLAEHRVDPV